MEDKHKTIKIIFFVFVCVLALRVFVFEGFVVQGVSMSPTIENGDYVLVEKVSYKLHKPEKGDIIVALNRQGQRVVKRVVGLPGEIMEVQGKPWNIDPGEYYLAGDNSSESIDSRDFGPVDPWDIQGRVFGSINFNALKYSVF